MRCVCVTIAVDMGHLNEFIILYEASMEYPGKLNTVHMNAYDGNRNLLVYRNSRL